MSFARAKLSTSVITWVILHPGQIAHYKIPRHWRFVDSFPMTVTGKIQKYKMREQAIEELNLAGAAAVVTA